MDSTKTSIRIFLLLIALGILYFPACALIEGRIVDPVNSLHSYVFWQEMPVIFGGWVVLYTLVALLFLMCAAGMIVVDGAGIYMGFQAKVLMDIRKAKRPGAPRYKSRITPEMRANFDKRLASAQKEVAELRMKEQPPSLVIVALGFAFGFMNLFVSIVTISGDMVFPKECETRENDICKFENLLYGWGGRPTVSVFWVLVTALIFSATYFVYRQRRLIEK